MTTPPTANQNSHYDAGVSGGEFVLNEQQQNLKQRAVRGGAVTIVYQLAEQALSLIATIFLARLLLPEDYGLIGMITVITGLMLAFSDVGLSAATIQWANIESQVISTLFWINVTIGTALMVMTILLSPALAWFYGEPRLTMIAIALSIGFVLTSLAVQHRALLKRQMRFMPMAIIDTAATICGLTAGIAAAMSGLGVWALVIRLVLPEIIATSGIWLVCRWRPGRPIWSPEVRRMVIFGGNITGVGMINHLANNIDNLLLGKFYGAGQLGLYSKAYGLFMLPLRRINEPIAAVAIPTLSRLVDDSERYRQGYLRIVAMVCLLTMPLVAFLTANADWIIWLALGDQWVGASRIFALLGIGGLVIPFSYTIGWLLISQGRAAEHMRLGTLNAVLLIASIVIGLPWGAEGVAASVGIGALLVRTPTLFQLVGRTGPIRTRDLYLSGAPFAVAAGAIIGVTALFRIWFGTGHPLLGIVITSAITAFITFGVLMIFPAGRAALREVRSLPGIILRRKAREQS
jgi:PST family polysaccharide transporter